MVIREGLQRGHQERIARVIDMGITPPADAQSIAEWYSNTADHSTPKNGEPSRGNFTGDSFGESRPTPKIISLDAKLVAPDPTLPRAEKGLSETTLFELK